jgi:aldehyde dehydrogenase (NAD+)
MNSIPRPDFAAMQAKLLGGGPKKLLIGSEWVPAVSGKTFPSINPATGEEIARLAEGGAEDIDRAVIEARKAFEGPWSRFTPYQRQDLILKFADIIEKNWDELTLLDTLDMGVPYQRGSRQNILSRLRFCAGLATVLNGETIRPSAPGEYFSYTVKEPVGVVGVIIAWNGPLFAATWKLGPALATGCTVVLKPAEEASLTAVRLAELALEVGVPPGVINVVTGGGMAGARLAEHPDVDKIAFTGSNETGQKIVRASAGNMKRLSLELGGKSPNIVFADADLDAAVPGAAMGVFANTGQICSAGTRLFVEQSIYEEFVWRVAEYGKTLKVGNGLDPATQLGPVVSAQHLERVTGYMALGKEEGATPLTGGARLTEGDLAKGYFVPPTVFANVDPSMRIAREEIFGPVLSAIPFTDFDDAVRAANDTRFGLGSGVWTRDISKAHRMAARIRAGSVWVNCYGLMDAAIPFGGFKESGYGRESGIQHLDDYLEVKAVSIKVG